MILELVCYFLSTNILFDVVIVWMLDCFARNRYDSAYYKNFFKKNGVKVISATEAVSSGAEGILFESMLEGYAEYYSAELAEKINRGLTENTLKCKYNGGTVALGFAIDENQNYQINPITAPIVREIFDNYPLITKLYCGKCMSFMVGKSGNAKGRRYAYYKCVNTKRNKTCDKKPVKKDWIENIVISQVIRFINNDELIEKLINKIMSMQDKESPTLKVLKKQLLQTNKAIENMITAIEQGIITKSTKVRLDELEKTKENLETEIAKESITHSMISREFLVEWFANFKNLDLTNLENRRMLIDIFVNSVILYDDRIDFYFNYTDNIKSLSVSELNNVSDLDYPSPPNIQSLHRICYVFSVCRKRHSKSCAFFDGCNIMG